VQSGVKAPAKRPAIGLCGDTREPILTANNFDISVKGFGSEDASAKPRKEPVTA